MGKYSANIGADITYYGEVEFEAPNDKAAIKTAKYIAEFECPNLDDIGDTNNVRITDIRREADQETIAEDIQLSPRQSPEVVKLIKAAEKLLKRIGTMPGGTGFVELDNLDKAVKACK